jgi:carbonic anhydrase
MQSHIEHARTFPARIADRREDREDFAKLARGQRPQALFITCSDSRVVPSLFTGARPGEIFELRTAGNIVPRYNPRATCGAAATVEFALTALNIPDIVVCGHSHCGAIQGLMHKQVVQDMPLVGNWLGQAGHRPRTDHPTPPSRWAEGAGDVAQRHLLTQLGHLRTYPIVARRLSSRQLRLHAWFYTVETGEVLAHHPDTQDFQPL